MSTTPANVSSVAGLASSLDTVGISMRRSPPLWDPGLPGWVPSALGQRRTLLFCSRVEDPQALSPVPSWDTANKDFSRAALLSPTSQPTVSSSNQLQDSQMLRVRCMGLLIPRGFSLLP